MLHSEADEIDEMRASLRGFLIIYLENKWLFLDKIFEFEQKKQKS